MKDTIGRLSVLTYGLICYLIFGGIALYFACFLENIFVAKSLDSLRISPLPIALAVDSLLIALFAMQHSGMARQSFKRWWTEIIPQPIERSTYVLLSSLCLLILVISWQPIGITIWQFENPILIYGIYSLSALGLLLLAATTFMINHLDLYGLRQVYLNWKREAYTPLPFMTPSFYKVVRHPLYLGMFVAIWCAPTMTFAHFLFATLLTVYICSAVRLEERDLVKVYREIYRQYQNEVPMLIPAIFKRQKSNI